MMSVRKISFIVIIIHLNLSGQKTNSRILRQAKVQTHKMNHDDNRMQISFLFVMLISSSPKNYLHGVLGWQSLAYVLNVLY